MFGTVTHAMFPVASRRDAGTDVLAVTGMDTLELVSRLPTFWWSHADWRVQHAQ